MNPLVMEIHVSSNKGPRPFPREDNEVAKIHWRTFQSSTSGNIFLLASDKTHVALDYSQLMYIIKWEHTWTRNVKTWSELAMSSSTRCTAITGRIADSWSRLWSPVTCLTARRPSTPVIKIPVNWWSLLNIQEFLFHTASTHFVHTFSCWFSDVARLW